MGAIQTDITAGMRIQKEINPKLKREYIYNGNENQDKLFPSSIPSLQHMNAYECIISIHESPYKLFQHIFHSVSKLIKAFPKRKLTPHEVLCFCNFSQCFCKTDYTFNQSHCLETLRVNLYSSARSISI